MRMRNLQTGEHSVCFIATKDVDTQIKTMLRNRNGTDLNQPIITAADVMSWVIDNSKEYEKEGLVFYSNNAVNFVKKRAGLINFLASNDFVRFGKEVMDLERNGEHKDFASEQIFVDIISECFDTAIVSRISPNENSSSSVLISELFSNVKQHVVTLVNDNIADRTCFSSSLEEQQEREIELEKEVQVQLATPVIQHPFQHNLHPDVVAFVSGHALKLGGIRELEIPGIFASLDFLRVVESGAILRPVNWLVSREFEVGQEGDEMKSTSITVILLLSPYEVNELISQFWDGNAKARLHMFSPRIRKGQDILVNVANLQLGSDEDGCLIDGELLGKLHIFSGSLYLEGDEIEWARNVLVGLGQRFNVIKNVQQRLSYFPENSDMWKLLHW